MNGAEFVGRLRARIALQSPERTPDDIGGAAIAWSDEGEVWADIAAGGGSGSADFDGAVSNVSYRLAIRAPNDVRAGWRALWNGRVLNIDAVIAADEGVIELVCVEERL